MGLFGNDDEQNARLEALELHVRELSDIVIQGALDLVALRVGQINLQAQVDGKVAADDVDPAISALNEQLGEARVELEKAAAAATDSWATLHAGASEALSTLKQSVEDAAERIEREI
ncbi:MAG: hypothetical protein ACN4GT_14605 [Gammaproteobacteria bacterium]